MSPQARPSSIIYLTNRSAVETDDRCGMAYWWNQEEGNTGIVPKEEAAALAVGREIHEDIEVISKMDDLSPYHLESLIENILSTVPEEVKGNQRKLERLYRRLGWIAAWVLYMEPGLREKYEDISVEGELILDRDPLWVAVTPDRVMRHKKDNYLIYLEYKSTITASNKWLASWKYAIQLHLGIKAIEEEFVRRGVGEKITHAQIVGFLKGDDSKGFLHHPYVWGYKNTETGKWTHEYSKARGASWTAAPVWEYPDGIVKWVQSLGEEIGRQQFPFSPPVMLDERMLNSWVSRRLSREIEIEAVREECREDWDSRVVYFEPRTRNCRPAFGDPCPYLGPCWNASIQRNPLATGDFIRRNPHHEMEIIFQGE
jgi:hypothetical protein